MAITIISPNGGEVWTRGLTYNIRWTSAYLNVPGSTVTIELLKGNILSSVLSTNAQNDGIWEWKLNEFSPNIGTDFKIRVRNNSGGTGNVSAGTFTIKAAPIIVTQPSGGEILVRGTSYDINWTNTYTGGTVKIDLLKNGQLSRVLKTSTENTGLWTWNLNESSLEVGTGYKIRISNNSDSTFGTSIAEFTIKAAPPIVVTYPKGGEILTRGQTYDIKWTNTYVGGTVKIELLKAGVYLKTLATVALNDGYYSWMLSSTSTDIGTDFKIRITNNSDGTFGTSESNFTIKPAPIVITYPKGGDTFKRGLTYNITWTSITTGGTVTIELLKNGVYLKTLATIASNDGSYSWMLSSTSTDVGTDFKIRITHNITNEVGISAANFTITPADCSQIICTITIS